MQAIAAMTPAGAGRRSGRFHIPARRAQIYLGALILAKLVLLFVLALNSRFVMDEFVQFGWAKYFPHDLFDSVWPGKAVGYAVFYKLSHLIGWDARSILLGGRIQTALLACGTLAIVCAIARTIGRTRLQAAVVVLVLLSFSNLIERIFRTIAEPLAVFFAAAALLAAIKGPRSASKLLAAGFLCGLSFLTTQKAIYFDVALGLGLVVDALLARKYSEVLTRGALLVLGWLTAVAIYCIAFGGLHPVPILQHLFMGPAAVMSPTVAAAYGGLRNYVVQTLVLNPILYMFCFTGLIVAWTRIRDLEGAPRIALIFSTIVTALVFRHDQPWPYVFIMCLPFLALWVVEPFHAAENRPALWNVLAIVLVLGVAFSFVRNAAYLQIHDRDQLALIDRAEKLLGPTDVYFDGVGMLPNRAEPSTLWLDRTMILQTKHDGAKSEAYRIFSEDPPKVILWNYRLDDVSPLLAPLIRDSYVKIAPNIRVAGARLRPGQPTRFNVPVAGSYRLYSVTGQPLSSRLVLNGRLLEQPLALRRGPVSVTLTPGSPDALLLPEGDYSGLFATGADNPDLFAKVYS